MKQVWISLLCIVAALSFVSPVRADVLVLRNGRKLTGSVLEESPQQVIFKSTLGTLKIARNDIASLEKDGTLPEEVDGDAAFNAGALSQAETYYKAALQKTQPGTPERTRVEKKLENVAARQKTSEKSLVGQRLQALRQALANKKYDEVISGAEELLRTSLSESETSAIARLKAEAHFGKAQQLLDQMQFIEAEEQLKKAVQTYEPFYRAHLFLGERLLQSAYTQKEGIAEILKGLQYGSEEMTEQERVKFHYLAGRTLYQQNDYQGAASHFIECLRAKEKYQAYADAIDRAADCFVKIGEQTVLKNADQTIANLKRALELDPKKAKAWFLLGKLYRDLGRTDEAVEAFKKLLEVDPSFPYGHQFLALTYIDKKNYDEALSELNEEIKQRPDNYQAYVDRAEVQIELGNFADADKDLEYVTQRDPSRWEAFMARARLAYVQEEYDKAKENLSRVLALKPDAIEAHIYMGKVLRAQKDFDGAKQWLTNVVDYLEKIPDLTFKYKNYLAEAQTRLAEIDLAQDSPRQAETRLKMALQYVPNYAAALACLGDVKKRLASEVDPASRKSLYREAESYYKQAISADPKNPDYYLALGILYHKNLKDTRKAVENYNMYLKLGGKDKTNVTKWIEECGGSPTEEDATTSAPQKSE